jgi:ATP-dependent Lon protease
MSVGERPESESAELPPNRFGGRPAIGRGSVRRHVLVAEAVTALAGLLVGYDTGVVSGALLSWRTTSVDCRPSSRKLLAADRAGLTTVFLPARNEADLDEVPADLRDRLSVQLVSDAAELVSAAVVSVHEQSGAVGVAA